MAKMIQIRNVPDGLHRELKARAARAGMTLSDFLLREVAQVAERVPPEELLARVRSRERPDLPQTSTEIIRELRGDPHDDSPAPTSSTEAIRAQRDRGA